MEALHNDIRVGPHMQAMIARVADAAQVRPFYITLSVTVSSACN